MKTKQIAVALVLLSTMALTGCGRSETAEAFRRGLGEGSPRLKPLVDSYGRAIRQSDQYK